MDSTEDQAHPLLAHGAPSSVQRPDDIDNKSEASSQQEETGPEIALPRSIENDVIPETSILGRNIGRGSAFILIISRVIGSGIFATPGLIVKAVGSVGLSLLLWIIGAIITWFALSVFLEYGCMLPRSGGELIPLTV